MGKPRYDHALYRHSLTVFATLHTILCSTIPGSPFLIHCVRSRCDWPVPFSNFETIKKQSPRLSSSYRLASNNLKFKGSDLTLVFYRTQIGSLSSEGGTPFLGDVGMWALEHFWWARGLQCRLISSLFPLYMCRASLYSWVTYLVSIVLH